MDRHDPLPTAFDFPGCMECKRLFCAHQVQRVGRARMKWRRRQRRRLRRASRVAL